ncbi:MAG: tol-pal system protein YbgF [Nitrospirota bacterium]|nr:MAG: tol-pal system protein YbgF [Nitrospirota bacterium]
MPRFLLYIAISFLISGCITTGEYLSLKNDVNQLKKDSSSHERDLELIKKDFGVVKKESKRSVGLDSFDAIRESQAQIGNRLETVTRELATLQGKVDESSFRTANDLKEIEAELELMRSRLDRMEEQFESMKGEERVLREQKEKKADKPKEETKEKKAIKRDAGGDPKALYELAHEYLKSNNQDKARDTFSEFLEKYPDHDLADNSRFWIGETFYREKDYENAIIEYQKLVKNFPDSPKLPGALYKQALSFENIGDKKAAGVVLQLILQKFPKSPEADRAKKKLKALSGKS